MQLVLIAEEIVLEEIAQAVHVEQQKVCKIYLRGVHNILVGTKLIVDVLCRTNPVEMRMQLIKM